MRNILLTLQYDGTRYSGWQIQNNSITIQQRLQEAIEKTFKEKININGCSRTDAGVHALDYKCNFITNSRIPIDKVPIALNCNLPEDICVTDAKQVDKNFHARYSAIEKTYCYKIINSEYNNVFSRNYVYFYPYPLDCSLMKEACSFIIGKHNFKSFMASGSTVKNTVRTVKNLDIHVENNTIVIYITADGFLYNMVRIIAGTLIEVGNKRKKVEEIPQIISSLDRDLAGFTAPPHGLYLFRVNY